MNSEISRNTFSCRSPRLAASEEKKRKNWNSHMNVWPWTTLLLRNKLNVLTVKPSYSKMHAEWSNISLISATREYSTPKRRSNTAISFVVKSPYGSKIILPFLSFIYSCKVSRLFSHSFLLPFSYLPTALYTAKTDKHFELYNDSFYRLEAAARGAL